MHLARRHQADRAPYACDTEYNAGKLPGSDPFDTEKCRQPHRRQRHAGVDQRPPRGRRVCKCERKEKGNAAKNVSANTSRPIRSRGSIRKRRP